MPGSRRRRRLASDKRLLRVVDRPAQQCGARSPASIGSSVSLMRVARHEATGPPAACASSGTSTSRARVITGCTCGWRTRRATNGGKRGRLGAGPLRPGTAGSVFRPAGPRRSAAESPSTSSTGTPGWLAARSKCELPATTTWHGLRTEREGAQLVAYVDDERFRNGLYEFRAHAEDQAGNEASTATRADGATASLRLPARIDTRLAVGVPSRARGKRRRLDSNISAPFGRRVRLSGRLTNADGQPIEAARSRRLNGDPTAPRCRSAW